MRHRSYPGLCLVVSLGIAVGCTPVPDQSDVTGVDTTRVLNKIRCEVKQVLQAGGYPEVPGKFIRTKDGRSVWEDDKRYNPIIITYAYDAVSEENNNLSGGGTYSMPIHLGILTVGLNAGADRTRRGTDNITLSETFKELRNFPCDNSVDSAVHRYPILGNLGVERVIESYFRLMPMSAGSTEFQRVLFFKLKRNAGAKPSISIVPVPGRKLDANLDLRADRADTHEITIVLKSEKKKEDKTDEQKIWEKTVYVKFLDTFDSSGAIKKSDGGPPREAQADQGAVEEESIERAKERAQREAIDNRNGRDFRRLRRDLLGE